MATKKRKGFTPFKAPVNPPPGTYDPAIDAQVRAAQRGYGDLGQDYTVGKTRAQDDYLTASQNDQTDYRNALGDLTQTHDHSLSDLTQSHDRSLSDLLLGRTRGTEDYRTNLSTLARNYQNLGNAQGGTITQAAGGTFQGGALLQALQKRQANEAIDRAPIDTGYNRFLSDSQTQEGRVNQDFTTGSSRLNEDLATGSSRLQDELNRQLGALSLGLDRKYGDQGDLTVDLARAGRENTAYGIDATASRWGQAAGTGYTAPEKPANEHTDPRTGQTFRLVRTPAGQLVRMLPSGQTVRRPRYSLRTR
jgi:hypothetical protein